VSGCWKRLGRRDDNFTTFMCRLSCNLAASAFWYRQGMFRDCFLKSKWWSVSNGVFNVNDSSYPVYFYDLQSTLSLKMVRFCTWPSHCVSGCDRRNSRLIMIGMEKTKKLGALRAIVPRPRLLSYIDIWEWTWGSSAKFSVWPPDLWRGWCVEPNDWIFGLIDYITYCQLVMSVDWSPADFRARGLTMTRDNWEGTSVAVVQQIRTALPVRISLGACPSFPLRVGIGVGGLITQSLQLLVPITSASLGWRHKSG
jgi:hypothetical protein